MRSNFKKELLRSKKEQKQKRLVAVRVPNDVYRALEKLADETDTSISQVIIAALRKTLEIKGE